MKKIFSNALNRFLEIKKLNAQNYWFLFVFSFISFFTDYIRAGYWATLLLIRLTLLLYYFFGKFSNKRFKIITILCIVMSLLAIFNDDGQGRGALIATVAGVIMYLFSRGYGKKEDV